MKFINYLQSIAGVSIFPMISLFLFFAFFVVLTILVIKMNKKHISKMEHLPLEQTESTTSEMEFI